jgi:hypothetical protein
MPFGADNDDWGFSHEMLEVPRCRELFERVRKLPSLPVPSKFSTYRSIRDDGESRYGQTQQTPYGEALLATTMAHLKTCDIPGPQGAFVAASPDSQRVALYWH